MQINFLGCRRSTNAAALITPPSVVTIRPCTLLIRVKCSSACRHPSPKRPASVRRSSPRSEAVYHNTFYCSCSAPPTSSTTIPLFSLPLSLPPSFLCSNHSVTSGCRCQSQACRVCVCMLIAGGPGLPRRHTQHVSRSVTSAGQQRTAPFSPGLPGGCWRITEEINCTAEKKNVHGLDIS